MLNIDRARLRVGLLLLAGLAVMGAVIFWSLLQRGAHQGIRPYRTEDRSTLESLMQKDWYLLVDQGSTDFSMQYLFDHFAPTFHYPDNSLSIDVYEVENKPVGFVTYHLLEGYRGRIQFLSIDKEHRKKGYGKLLIEHAMQKLKERGVCLIDIAVRSHNETAKNLYLKLGFEEQWHTQGFTGLTKSICSPQHAFSYS